MLTLNELILIAIVPLILGLSVAFFLKRIAQSNYGQPIAALLTLIAGYFGRYATMNYAYAEGETIIQKVTQSSSQTAIELLSPSTAIQWTPIIAAACLAITVVIARVLSSDNPSDTGGSTPRRLLIRLLLYSVLVALTASAIARLLWTSVYFTDRFTLATQIGYVVLPALPIGAVWLGGFIIRLRWPRNHNQQTSRWASVSTVLLSASALVLLASSGSFTIGLLQIPVLSAAIVSAVSFHSNSSRCPLNSDAWLIASAVNLPIAIGFFFAEVRWETAILIVISSILVTSLPPLAHENNIKKLGIAIANCLPAIAAAIWAAIELSQAIAFAQL